ncbi:MAG: M23 family metallopeptidase, partial [Bacteroidales bacterium]
MKKNIYKVTLLNAFVALFSFAPIMAQKYGAVVQDKVDFKYPLNVNMNLSGNYGELRSNHFHGGVDFRIGGVVGAPIYATESGYVSQISVSPSGYGNALYITHANGYVSVYGHMLCFNDSLQAYVRGKQYENEEFKQLITLAPNVFPIAKGEMIGKAGNTGSSGGPHLHFEIRDTANVPLNIFARGILNIPDRTPPIINSVVFYGYNKDTGVVRNYYIGKKQGTQPYSSKYQKDGVIKLPSKSYIAIDAIDKQEGTAARLAVN